MHAGIVLLLTADASKGVWPGLRSAVRAGLGSGAPVPLMDLAAIGLDQPPWWPSPLMRDHAVAELKQAALQCLEAPECGAGGRFIVHLVGCLSDEASRRSALRLLPVITELTRRLALPDALVPVVTSTWLMPAGWTAYEGAEIFAWAAELGIAGSYAGPGYLFTTIVGRSCRTPSGSSRCVGEEEATRVAGRYVVTMQRTSLADRIMELYRGVLHDDEAVAIGIDRPDIGDAAAILWPGSEHRAPVGPIHQLDLRRAGVVAAEAAHGAADARPADGSFAVATGVRLRALQGYDEWRSRYMALPLHERMKLHCHPAVQQLASAWDAATADAEEEPPPEPTPEL